MTRLLYFIVALCIISCSGQKNAIDEPRPPILRDAQDEFSYAEIHQHLPWDEPDRVPDRIALTWSDDPATSFSVTWRTDTLGTEALAQIALATPSAQISEISDTFYAVTETLDLSLIENQLIQAHYHHMTFYNLLSDTLYVYRVGDGTAWSAWYQTRTASASPDPFKFIYVGDAQNGLHSHWSRNIRMAYAVAPDARFIVHAGDLVNVAHRNTEWGEWFEATGWISGMIPSIPIPGNHEYMPYNGNIGDVHLSVLWRPQFTLPLNGVAGLEETTYYIDYQGVRIIGLDSNRLPKEQVPWLEETLRTNPHRWALLTFHHPIYSSSGSRDNSELRALWKPIIDKYSVDLVMQGHDHTYARGRSLNVPDGSNRRDPSGTVYVNSVSGSKMYRLTGNRWKDRGASMDRAAQDTQLFQVIAIEADTLRFEAYTATGELYDAFDLIKKLDAPNEFIDRSETLGPERIE